MVVDAAGLGNDVYAFQLSIADETAPVAYKTSPGRNPNQCRQWWHGLTTPYPSLAGRNPNPDPNRVVLRSFRH